MSSFLEKLRGGGVQVDNAAPADVAGALVRKVEKAYAQQPFEQLGLTLSEDCEVLAVAPQSPAAAANVPVQSMVYECNGEFVETPAQLARVAEGSLLLVLRMQTTTAMAELIARVLREEEARLSGGGGGSASDSSSSLDLNELMRTTPRYNFVSSEHPLFRRYTRRLSAKRDAMALIHQRMQEAEEQQRREICARIARERDAALAAAEAEAQHQQRLREEEAATAAAAAQQAAAEVRDDATPAVTAPQQHDNAFVQMHDDTSAFTQRRVDADEDAAQRDTAMMTAAAAHTRAADTAAVAPCAPVDATPAAPPPDGNVPAAMVDASELMALVGMPPPPAAPVLPPLARGEGVSYVILPSEEYVLRDGSVAVLALKQRDGPLPRPPDGRPPKVNMSAVQAMRTKYDAMLAAAAAAPAQPQPLPAAAADEATATTTTPAPVHAASRDGERDSRRTRHRSDSRSASRQRRRRRDGSDEDGRSSSSRHHRSSSSRRHENSSGRRHRHRRDGSAAYDDDDRHRRHRSPPSSTSHRRSRYDERRY